MTLSGFQTGLLAVFLLLLMFGMGSTLGMANFRAVLARPAPLAIGLASQFGWMPLIALGLGRALGLDDASAVGLLIMGCSSGGTTSNFFSYLARADLALSISMTVISTIAGVVMIPLVLWAYAGSFAGPELAIPYRDVATTLFVMLVPVGLGIALRSRRPRAARLAERIGTTAGFLVLALVIVGGVLREGEVLFGIPARVYLAATALGPLGFGLGWLGARGLGLAPPQRRSVSLETGIQNAPLALGIILLSFDAETAQRALVAPALYGVIVVPLSGLAAWIFSRASASSDGVSA